MRATLSTRFIWIAGILIAMLARPCIGYERLPLLQINETQGLPGTIVRALAQDHSGLIWIGLEANGLCRFDGTEYVRYLFDPNDPESMSSNAISSIHTDSTGRVWVGTLNGLNRIIEDTRNVFRFLYDPNNQNSLGGLTINDVVEDANGRIWVATENGASRYDEASNAFVNYKISNDSLSESSSYECHDLYVDRMGKLWFCTADGIFQYDLESDSISLHEELYRFLDTGPSTVTFNMVEDHSQRLWIGTQAGLSVFDRSGENHEQFIFTRNSEDSTQIGVYRLIIDRMGFVWAATFSNGIRVINPDTMEVDVHRRNLLRPKSLGSDYPRSLLEDRSGLVWIGTKFQGIYLYDRERETFPHYSGRAVSSLGIKKANADILAIEVSHDDSIWLGTVDLGLRRFNAEDNSYELFDQAFGLNDQRVEDIFEDSKYNLWMATAKGISKLNPSRTRIDNFPNAMTRKIVEGDQGTLFIGTTTGLILFDVETSEYRSLESAGIEENPILTSAEIKTMLRDDMGNLWFGTHHEGLFRLEISSKHLSHFTHNAVDRTTLGSNYVRSLAQDLKGRLWVGLRQGGLCLFNPDTNEFQQMFDASHPILNSIFSMIIDDRGKLWLSSSNGITQWDPESNEWVNYDKRYGLQDNIFNPNAFSKNSKGDLFFAGNEGLNIFNPEKIRTESTQESTVITSLKVFSEESIHKMDSNRNLTLEHDQNHITFSFSLTDYSSFFRNEYSYILEGFDLDWVQSGKRNYAAYTSLPPGEYIFRVKGRTPAGTWPQNATIIRITVLYPFWRTIPFYLLATGLIVASTLLAHNLSMRSERKRRLWLEALVEKRTDNWKRANAKLEGYQAGLEKRIEERTFDLERAKLKAEESDQLKSSFLENMSHEIRTPMNAIIGFSTMIGIERLNVETREEYLRQIVVNSDDLLALFDNILEVSSMETSQSKVIEEDVIVSKLIEEVCFMHSKNLPKGSNDLLIRCDIDSNTPSVILTDREKLKHLLNNLIGNSIKYTHRGEIVIYCEYIWKSGIILFQITDTGIGIPEDKLRSIFESFRKIEDDSKEIFRGAGLGLFVVNHLVNIMGGKVWVTSEEGKGSSFSFEIPAVAKIESNKELDNTPDKVPKHGQQS